MCFKAGMDVVSVQKKKNTQSFLKIKNCSHNSNKKNLTRLHTVFYLYLEISIGKKLQEYKISPVSSTIVYKTPCTQTSGDLPGMASE